MHDFSLLIKKLKISTSFGENKSWLNAKGIKHLPTGTLVNGQSALYWPLAANKTMGAWGRGAEKRGESNCKEEATLYSNPQVRFKNYLNPFKEIGENAPSLFSRNKNSELKQ